MHGYDLNGKEKAALPASSRAAEVGAETSLSTAATANTNRWINGSRPNQPATELAFEPRVTVWLGDWRDENLSPTAKF
jgi:hypothetical protein